MSSAGNSYLLDAVAAALVGYAVLAVNPNDRGGLHRRRPELSALVDTGSLDGRAA